MDEKLHTSLVSIIIPTYNRENDLLECIESIKKSDYKHYEIIVVKDGSETRYKKIPRMKDIMYIEQEKSGFAKVCNSGIKNANGEIIILLNDDTIVDSKWISELIKPLALNDVGITCGKIYYYENNQKSKKIWYGGGIILPFLPRIVWHLPLKRYSEENENITKETRFATGCAMAFRKELIKKVGLLDEKYISYFEDADFSIRVNRAGYKILYIPNAKIWHKISASYVKHSKIWYFYRERNRILFIKKNFLAFLPIVIIYGIIIGLAVIFKKIINERDYNYIKIIFQALKEGILT